ncbi:MAG: glucose 1-dehydrogenase [Actinomycetaceae bacterium]|nr:glucose 1-dehydrogenase [Actinomycetaceae bacterium]
MPHHIYRFEDKAVIITGGAGGIGLSTAIRLAEEGAKITLVDISEEGLAKAKQQLLEEVPGAEVLTCVADVSNEDDVKAYVAATVEAYGAIDGFFNNAGIDGKRFPLPDYTPEEFERVMTINSTGVFLGLKHVLEQMAKQGRGAIVNTASIGGILGWSSQYGYIASKHAVVGMTRAAAAEFACKGLQINAVAPGGIKTPMAADAMRQLNPDDPSAAERQFAARIPAKRMGTPEELAGAVAFLLSEDAAFINGHILLVDGGQTCQ